jgi:hypothetical protein
LEGHGNTLEKLDRGGDFGYGAEQRCPSGICANKDSECPGKGATGHSEEQELFMSKTLMAAVVAAFGLSVLAGCQPNRNEEFIMVEPAPQPIFVEPASHKFR